MVSNFLRYVGIMYIVATIFVPCFATDFSPIAKKDYQFFGKGIHEELDRLSREYREAIWPSTKEMPRYAVPQTDIPADVLIEAVRWTKIMIKGKWIPNDLANRFVGLKEYRPVFDYLGARYVSGGYEIQILEGGAVCLLVNTGRVQRRIGVTETRQAIELYLKDSIKKFLNFPEDKIDKIEFKLKCVSLAREGMLYYGVMDCEYNNMDPDHRNWWHHIYVWSDGKCVFFSMVEMDGTHPKKVSARPGLIRFKRKTPPTKESSKQVPLRPERRGRGR